MSAVRLTVAQALVRFLGVQFSERDGHRQRLIPACLGIFGHGNVAGLGQALLQAHVTGADDLPYHLARNEQAMVHTAVGFARARNRLQTLACTSSIGPGATNMITGAAVATINRLPVLLLPGDVFATRAAGAVLQQLEVPGEPGTTVNDAFRPVSRFFARVERPEQLPEALLGAMRVLTDPAETGAVTLALPQDVQAEAYDWPLQLFADRTWHVPRLGPDAAAVRRAADAIAAAKRPLIVVGGGAVYSEASSALRAFIDDRGIPVVDTHAGKGTVPFDHPCYAGPLGVSGCPPANTLAGEADLVVGVGTRYSDFTTGSHTVFSADARFVNINVASFDAAKYAGVMVVGDAATAVASLAARLDYRADSSWTARMVELRDHWHSIASAAGAGPAGEAPVQTAIVGAVNDAVLERSGTVVCAAGSMPGQLQMLWRAREPAEYHVEYGYSCMGYEIAGALGMKLGAPERPVVALVGDGSYLMMSQEIVTAVSERVPLTIVLVDNGGFGSIGALSESLGGQRFGTAYRYRDPATGLLDGDPLPVNLAENAASLGAQVRSARTLADLRTALDAAMAATHVTVIHLRTDPRSPAPESGCWWDVPVAEVSEVASSRLARAAYERAKAGQHRPL